MLTRKRTVLFLLLATVLMLFTAVASAHEGARHFIANLAELNGSGATGTAHITLSDDQLTVRIEAWGLAAGQTHAQHIHGFAEPSNRTCPPPGADADGDGLVSVGEGVPFYGGVLRPLTPFPTAAADETVTYEMTFSGSDLDALRPLNTLQNRAIVLHGMNVDGTYVPSLPVACGQIWPAH